MNIIKVLVLLSVLFISIPDAKASVWYDKIPESGEYVPISEEVLIQDITENANSSEDPFYAFPEEDEEQGGQQAGSDQPSGKSAPAGINRGLAWTFVALGLIACVSILVYIHRIQKKPKT